MLAQGIPSLMVLAVGSDVGIVQYRIRRGSAGGMAEVNLVVGNRLNSF